MNTAQLLISGRGMRKFAFLAAISVGFVVLGHCCDTSSGQEQALISELIRDLKDEATDVRRAAAVALDCGPKANVAVPALVASLTDEDALVRLYAAQTLGGLGAAALPSLIEALKDEDAVVRTGAAVALERVGPEARAAVRALVEALLDDSARVRLYAASGLGRIGSEAKAAVSALAEALKDEHASVRY